MKASRSPCPPADGLSTAQVATITDTIVKETDYTAPQIKVIEVKADAQDAVNHLPNTSRSDRARMPTILKWNCQRAPKGGTCHDSYNLKQEAEIIYGIQSLYLPAPIMK